jgi:hypothetical protein
VYVDTLSRTVGVALISLVLWMGMTTPANGQPQPQAAPQQAVLQDRLLPPPQPQLTPYRPYGDQGQRVEPGHTSLKKSRFLFLKSLGGHIKPLASVPADMSPWEKSR